MTNKVIVSILVIIVILVGGAGYYSYTLNQQINDLSERLTTFETQQTAQVDALGNELSTLRTETQNSLGALEKKSGEALAEIDTVKKDLLVTQNQVTGVQEKTNSLEDRLSTAVTEFSQATIDASEVYQKVIQATVRISNGQNPSGCGVIFDTEGHVVTAQHVIDGLSPIYVTLHDGSVSPATVIGQCPFSDVAVLKLEKDPSIEPPPLADSGQVKIGEPVAAVGSPFDLKDTLTTGIISQINRYTVVQQNTQSRALANLFQFDAAVNPGNSGGPLANARGEIIGIVVARIPPVEGTGIYWAVSANKVKRVAEALIANGSFDYPWLGVVITNLSPQIVQDRTLETSNGVLVTAIISDSPAAAADIKINDIITSIDGIPVKDTGDIVSYLGEFKSVGDTATIGLIRDATKMETSVEVGKRQQ